MKKILSLAIILSCALTSVSWADGPGGNNHGQQQVWQQDAGRGGPNGNRQQGPQANNHQGNGDNRGPAHGDKGPQGNPHQARRTTLRGTGMISAKVIRRRNVFAAMITG